MGKAGYLYIITNPAFEGWVKVGTTYDLAHRIHVYQTSDPFRQYKVEYSLHHPNFREAEKKIKEVMKHFALEIKNEWYRINLDFAKSRLDEALESYNNGEWNIL
jgi:hypothetical protein